MRIRYETGFATLIQFIVMSLFNVATMIGSMIAACSGERPNCGESLFLSPLYFLLVVTWFGILAALGFVTQERRSKRLALVLISAELLVLFVASINARGTEDRLSLVTSLVDIALALWVILLAVRLVRSKGGRIVARQVRRRRIES